MKLEQQVTSLELSKKLKELGVKQESYFYWGFDAQKGFEGGLVILESHSPYSEKYSAFTVAELGEMLPYEVTHKDQFWYWSTGKAGVVDDRWMYKLENAHITLPVEFLCIGTADTEADARAKMLIYLLENNLITL